MLTDEELAAVPEELLKDLLRYSEYGWRDRRIVSLLARCYPVVLTEADALSGGLCTGCVYRFFS